MNIEKNNKIIIISSPSGAGKTTICKYLLKKNKNLTLSVSYTSRNIRNNEKNGRDYYFVSRSKFLNLKKNEFFIETAEVFKNYYGSPYKNIKYAFNKNKHILFDIDWQGARKLRKKYKKDQIIDFFILPPSIKELKKRLIKRGRDNKEEIKLRLSLAIKEMQHFKEYNYIIINENIQKTVGNLNKIINYHEFIKDNNKLLSKKLKTLVQK